MIVASCIMGYLFIAACVFVGWEAWLLLDRHRLNADDHGASMMVGLLWPISLTAISFYWVGCGLAWVARRIAGR